MSDIRDKNYEIKYYYTDPCTCEEICVSKDTVLNFEKFDPIYAPVFVDMLITGHKTLKNILTENIKKHDCYKYYIYLKYPMEVGTIFRIKPELRDYWLSDFKGRDKKGSYIYFLKSMDNLSINEIDEKVLIKGVNIYRKGILKNQN